MNKEIVRKKIELLIGKRFKFRFNGSRNQYEKFTGIITNTFPSVFIVVTDDENHRIRSFSYNDVITSNLLIFEK